MNKQISERKECCPLLERGESEIEEECLLVKIWRAFIKQLEEPVELEDLQKMCGG